MSFRDQRQGLPLCVPDLTRRRFVQGLAIGGVMTGFGLVTAPIFAKPTPSTGQQSLRGTDFHLEIGREPGREIQLHLTGNMSRYMWSVDGIKFSGAEPVRLRYGERLRITLVNDTMMNHPIHLHGMWSDLETGDGRHIPRKHTVVVQPRAKISYLVTADARGGWAYHCHLLYHMPGMFRKVVVS